jgi:hypothetical protein
MDADMNREERRRIEAAQRRARESNAQPYHGPVESAYRAKMDVLASVIDAFLNSEVKDGDPKPDEKQTGFVLLVFPFADAERPDRNRLNYISNAERIDVATLFKEIIARWEGPQGSAGTA